MTSRCMYCGCTELLMTDFGNYIKLCQNPTHVLVVAGVAYSIH